MYPSRPPLFLPLVRRALDRPRSGEMNTTTIVIIILAIVGGILLLTCAVGVALLLPAVQASRGAARQTQSRNNLHQMGLALHNYHDVYSQFPPGGIYGEDGTDFHSWQAMLLPYADQAPLYNRIDFHQPWDDPVNAGLFSTVIPVYQHPAVAESPLNPQGFAVSHYAANSQLFLPNGTTRIRDITDGTSNTIMAGEVATGFKPWGDPSNVRDPADGIGFGADTFFGPTGQGGTMILLGDGASRSIQNDIDPAVLRALATPAGGERVDNF